MSKPLVRACLWGLPSGVPAVSSLDERARPVWRLRGVLQSSATTPSSDSASGGFPCGRWSCIAEKCLRASTTHFPSGNNCGAALDAPDVA